MTNASRPEPRHFPLARTAVADEADWLAGRAHVLVMAVLFIGGLTAGYFMLPGISEKVAALEKDGQFRLALRTLEQQYDQGDRRQRTLFQMHRLYEQFGDIAGARRVLEQLVEQRPRDINLNRQLAALYRQAQDEPAYIGAIKAGLKLRYQEASCRELIGIFRLQGNAVQEEQQIKECRDLGYDRTEDLLRLGLITAAEGKLVEAASVLRTLDDKRRLEQPRDQLTLFSVLLENSEARDAYRRGLRWFRSGGDENLALSMIDQLADDDRYDLAVEFAKSTGTPGDGITLSIPELMLDRGQIPGAKALLALWLERAKLDQSALAGRFVEAALMAQDYELAFTGAQRFGLQRMAQSDLVSLAEALGAAGRQADFHAVRGYLGDVTVTANPLLDAAIELLAGNRERAAELVQKVDATDLDEWRAMLLSQISARLGLRPANDARTRAGGVASTDARATAGQTPTTGMGMESPHEAVATSPAVAERKPAATTRAVRRLRIVRRTQRAKTAASRPPGKGP